MKLTIRSIQTGYLVEAGQEEHAFETLADTLRFISEYIDPGSRHGEKRVYVIEAPGDKHPDWTEKHSEILFGE